MTPAEARAAMAVVREEVDELTANERRVALEFFSGHHAGNKVQSYLAVFPEASYGTASTECDLLLRRPRVREFLEKLQRQLIADVVGDLKEWSEMEPEARAVIRLSYQGRLRNRLALDAAMYVCNRVLGLPTANVDITVATKERVVSATRAFHSRIAQEGEQKRLKPSHEGRQEVVVGDS